MRKFLKIFAKYQSHVPTETGNIRVGFDRRVAILADFPSLATSSCLSHVINLQAKAAEAERSRRDGRRWMLNKYPAGGRNLGSLVLESVTRERGVRLCLIYFHCQEARH